MRLRTFLVRRTIHTVITLVIVLVLLFVIFRLMPGDPTRFFIRPGQTAQDEEDLRVSFGFAHREPAPGHGYRAAFETTGEGTYEITLTASDTQGRSKDFYYTYTKQIPPVVVEPVVVVNASAQSGAIPANVHPGANITFRGLLRNAPAAATFQPRVTVSREGAVVKAIAPTKDRSDGTSFNATWTPTGVGAYSVTVAFQRENSTEAPHLGFSGVAVNEADPSPFQLVTTGEWGFRTEPTTDRLDRAWIHINVTAQGAPIAQVVLSARSPDGSVDHLTMFHPLIAVRNNLLEEFWTYMVNMLQGNFGKSLYTRQDVWYEISTRAGPTLLLFGSAVVISYVLGILIGAVLAWRRGSKMELSAIVVSLFFYSMPVFWFGLILLWLFAFTIKIGDPPHGLFPLRGFADIEAVQAGGLTYVGNVMWHMALPLLNLVILSLAGHLLLMRNSMLEVMGEDYITTAKAKGLSERRIMYRHAARNALLPVVTAFALAISGVISGGVLTETIFSWPGMGAFLIQSTLNQDFPSVQGAFYLLAVLTILANLIADVLYAYLDPRVRL